MFWHHFDYVLQTGSVCDILTTTDYIQIFCIYTVWKKNKPWTFFLISFATWFLFCSKIGYMTFSVFICYAFTSIMIFVFSAHPKTLAMYRIWNNLWMNGLPVRTSYVPFPTAHVAGWLSSTVVPEFNHLSVPVYW